ncbi:glyoxalase [Chitiniphilus shinanonensis]|uniref:Glyoxalase n=1 Tax=Chitiniphilus shinanonensis TaxID=553088 RepID=A0ABQ6C0M9_9NEIS|nr:VOC family protein [Chitiniphilus shinanonensis]GLS06052.1 glyoxalase [Chitiniphilus shinanonensis]
MIDHTGINVSNLEQSKQFYQAVLATLGYAVRLDFGVAVGFGDGKAEAGDDPGGDFWISQGEPYTPRSHIAFRAGSAEQVAAFYQAALAAGARDNGAPGPRPHYHPGYYAAFAYDPDGYNIEAVFHGGD